MNQSVEEERKTLLLELQMILEIARRTNENVIRSVELLQHEMPTGIARNIQQQNFQRSFIELVNANKTTLGELLSLIGED